MNKDILWWLAPIILGLLLGLFIATHTYQTLDQYDAYGHLIH